MNSSDPLIRKSWLQLSCLQVGAVICLPVIMVGQELARSYGVWPAVAAIALGNALLLMLSCLMSTMSTSSNKTTVEHAKNYFGEGGIRLLALLFTAGMVGWFALQLNIVSLGLVEFAQGYFASTLHVEAVAGIFGAVITCFALRGLSTFAVVANINLAAFILTIGWILLHERPEMTSIVEWSFRGISLVVALAIGIVIDMPTVFRHANTPREGIVAASILFGIALPLIEGVGVYLGSGERSLLEILYGDNNLLWGIWVAIFLMMTSWTACQCNIYSATASVEPLFNGSFKQRTLLLGSVGTLIAMANPMSFMTSMIELLGLGFVAMGSVMISGYLLGRATPFVSLICWLLGTCAGLGTFFQWGKLTEMPALDAFIVTAIMMIIYQFKQSRRMEYASVSNR